VTSTRPKAGSAINANAPGLKSKSKGLHPVHLSTTVTSTVTLPWPSLFLVARILRPQNGLSFGFVVVWAESAINSETTRNGKAVGHGYNGRVKDRDRDRVIGDYRIVANLLHRSCPRTKKWFHNSRDLEHNTSNHRKIFPPYFLAKANSAHCP
jgi:hypothetical protein